MAVVRVHIPENLGCGGWIGMMCLSALLLVLNASIGDIVLGVVERILGRGVVNPRLSQVLLFAMPLILLAAELWFGAILGRFIPRGNGSETSNGNGHSPSGKT